MARESLRLVAGGGDDGRTSRVVPILAGSAVLAFGLCATWFGAGTERDRGGPRERGQALVEQTLADGLDDPGVIDGLRQFRGDVGRRPLDSMARVVYAGLLTTFSRTIADLDVPAFHARRAAALAPVTVPVVRRAAIVLHATGHFDDANALIREMFEYDPDSAADLLATLRPTFIDPVTEKVVPDLPAAWLAWSKRLRVDDGEAADLVLQTAAERWPTDLDVVGEAALRATWRRDWAAVLELTRTESLPEIQFDARILAARSLARVKTGDTESAEEDAARALELSNDSASVLVFVGETRYALGQVARARELWSRALWRTPDSAENMKVAIRTRLARLEDEHGRPDAALRAWKAVLELDPEHRRARDRIFALTGTIPSPAPPP